MNIYDGLDDTAPIIMSICGDNATSGIRLRSTGNNMFIMLRSGPLNGGNMQFQADFNTTAPFSGMYISIFSHFSPLSLLVTLNQSCRVNQ